MLVVRQPHKFFVVWSGRCSFASIENIIPPTTQAGPTRLKLLGYGTFAHRVGKTLSVTLLASSWLRLIQIRRPAPCVVLLHNCLVYQAFQHRTTISVFLGGPRARIPRRTGLAVQSWTLPGSVGRIYDPTIDCCKICRSVSWRYILYR